MKVSTFLASLVLAALAACEPCCAGPVGAPGNTPLVVEPMVFDDQTSSYRVVDEGDEVRLVVGGQGGLMIVGGVRAQNVLPCGVDVTTTLYSPDGGVYAQIARYQSLRVEDGWAMTRDSMDDGAFIRTCDYGQSQFEGEPFSLEVTVTDSNGNSGTARRTVFPSCGSLGTFCDEDCNLTVDGGM